MDKGLLVKPANGTAYPKETVAALTKLTPEQVRESASRGQLPGSIGPAATTGSGTSRRATPAARSTS
jgi:hypothetical protein